jgi:two-component system nitrate/nitrite response regulator NarL
VVAVLRVLILGDDVLARNGLGAALDAAEDLRVVDRVGTRELASAVRAHRPDVLVWDAGVDHAVDLDQLREAANVGLPVVGVLAHETLAPSLLGVGFRGIVGRASDPERLLAAIRAVSADLIALDPAVAEAALRMRSQGDALLEPLTARERQVLALLAEGLTNRAIAERLAITDHTVKFHVNAILGKLGVESRAEAIVQAIRQGLVVI